MRWRKLFSGLALISVCACTHNIYIVGRTTGATGTASVTTFGDKSGNISINLAGKIFTGQWVYLPTGGSLGFASATATSGAQSATAFGSAVGMPMGGPGSVLASAPDGSALRCAFSWSEWGHTGIGVCQDNKGEIYDLQIS
ncbi:MAG: hypothetical protein HY059_16195 [Proteobacteria bacterium]|nr:hypothetical protein [Pseudomonadota bacterium]